MLTNPSCFCVFVAKHICISQPGSLEYHNCAEAKTKAPNRHFCSHTVNVLDLIYKNKNVFLSKHRMKSEQFGWNLPVLVELILPLWMDLRETRTPTYLHLKPGSSNPQVSICVPCAYPQTRTAAASNIVTLVPMQCLYSVVIVLNFKHPNVCVSGGWMQSCDCRSVILLDCYLAV